jgi:hypothetical protein
MGHKSNFSLNTKFGHDSLELALHTAQCQPNSKSSYFFLLAVPFACSLRLCKNPPMGRAARNLNALGTSQFCFR